MKTNKSESTVFTFFGVLCSLGVIAFILSLYGLANDTIKKQRTAQYREHNYSATVQSINNKDIVLGVGIGIYEKNYDWHIKEDAFQVTLINTSGKTKPILGEEFRLYLHPNQDIEIISTHDQRVAFIIKKHE